MFSSDPSFQNQTTRLKDLLQKIAGVSAHNKNRGRVSISKWTLQEKW
ncbi:hypothetical protein ATPR_0941 [Acetobacter tropicalis NBRC 101654]|uniref:Uncharacterized protein n=1 Tax=Acetobacter tropicalis NBRC 101654 TaxID=749388 RepID=F7VC42_9PROT|nr:hypothetical protein ATPR_0941 [Acetobacter tropicalis NBRC 101654]